MKTHLRRIALAVLFLIIVPSCKKDDASNQNAGVQPIKDQTDVKAQSDGTQQAAVRTERPTQSASLVEPTVVPNEFVFADWPGDAFGAAMDQKHGRLLVVGPWEKSVGLFQEGWAKRTDWKTPDKLLTVEGTPVSIAIIPQDDHEWIAVGLSDPNKIVFFDCESLAPANFEIDLKQNAAFRLFPVIQGEQSILLCVLGHVQSRSHGNLLGSMHGLVVIDWKTKATRSSSDDIKDVAISSDKAWVYLIRSMNEVTRTPLSYFSDLFKPLPPNYDPSPRFEWKKLPEPSNQPTDFEYRLQTCQVNLALSPTGNELANGKGVYDVDLKKRQSQFEFAPMVFARHAGFCSGIQVTDTEQRWVIASSNDGRIVESKTIPQSWSLNIKEPVRSSLDNSLRMGTMHVDEKQNVIAYFSLKGIGLFRNISQDIHQLESLAHRNVPDESAAVGHNYRFLPNVASTIQKVELLEGPSGSEVRDGELRWTPNFKDIGEHSFRLRLHGAHSSRDIAWKTYASVPFHKPSFCIEGLAIVDGTKDLLIWGRKRIRRVSTEVTEQTEVALLNVDTWQSRVSSTLPMHIVDGRTEEGRLLLLNDKQRVVEISPNDLHILSETLASEDWRFVARNPDLRSNSFQTLSQSLDFNRVELPNCRMIDGVLFDDRKKPVLILQISTLDQMSGIRAHTELGWKLFNRPMEGYSIRQQGFEFFDHYPKLINDPRLQVPVGFANVQNMGRTGLVVYQGTKKKPQFIPFFDNQQFPFDCGTGFSMDVSDQHIYVSFRGMIFILPKDALPRTEVFHLVPRQSVTELSRRDKTSVTYTANGAARFELAFAKADQVRELESFDKLEKLQSADGQFQIDPNPAIQEAILLHAERRKSMFDTFSQWDKAQREQEAKRFEHAIGKKLKGRLVEVPVVVRAINSDGEISQIAHFYFVDCPVAEFERNAPTRGTRDNKKPLQNASDASREWTNRSGKKVKGVYVRQNNGTVEIQSGAKVFRIPIASLSDEDQAWLKEHTQP